MRKVAAPLTALTDALDTARHDPKRLAACAKALERSRGGVPSDPANPGDPALLDVPTMCEHLAALERDPVAGPARALGEVVREHVVRWHHSQKKRYRGISLFYQPVSARDRERSYIFASNAEDAAMDGAYYARLALSEATGWHRVALDPLQPGARGK